jgi:hypothetical protein
MKLFSLYSTAIALSCSAVAFMGHAQAASTRAPRALQRIEDSYELSQLVELNGESYSEGNGSYQVYENPTNLSAAHLRQCRPVKLESAVAWLRKEFEGPYLGGDDFNGKAITQKYIDKALKDFAQLLGKGPLVRCFSKEKEPDAGSEEPLRKWTSYSNTQTQYRVLFVILDPNV